MRRSEDFLTWHWRSVENSSFKRFLKLRELSRYAEHHCYSRSCPSSVGTLNIPILIVQMAVHSIKLKWRIQGRNDNIIGKNSGSIGDNLRPLTSSK